MISRMSLKMKLGVGFGVLLVIVAVLGFVSLRALKSLQSSASTVSASLEKKELIAGIEEAIEKQSCGLRGFLLNGEEAMLSHRELGRREEQERMSKLEAVLQTEEGKKLFAELQRATTDTRALQDEQFSLARKGNMKEVLVLAGSPRALQLRSELGKALKALQERYEKQREQAHAAQRQTESGTRTVVVLLAVIGLAVGCLVAVLIARSVAVAIARMYSLIQEIAVNNLAVEDMQITSEDEIGKAGAALNTMKNNLKEIIQSIAGTAEHVASASEEISSSASLQAQGAETQKDQAAQVATAMQEMSSTVLQVSENSNKAAEASRAAAETARKGGSIVDETLTRMRAIAESVSSTAKKVEELGKSSDQIGRIIGVIDDIADQTNLLALNAAIEAARAGEQGRGFAVVADEVRKLAERTTTATKEIAQMIQTVQSETKMAVTAMEAGTKQVEEGVTSTAQAGDALKEIIHMSEQVGEMITHVATAATEQSSASEEVNNNMEQIAKLVKESADGAQQSAKACQDLSGLALDLQKMVSNFQLGSNGFQGAGRRRAAGRQGTDEQAQRPKAFAARAR